MLNVRIGGVTFEGTPRDRRQAFVIDPDSWAGWDDGPAVRREDIARPGQHGSFALRGFRVARVISIGGWIVAKSPQELQHMGNRVKALLADGGAGRITVDQPLGSTWADVMLVDKPMVKVRGASEREATFQIQFWSADPRKYGEIREFAAGEAAVQYGNFPATPKIIVSGVAASGYTVTGPDGRQVIVYHPLVASQPHTIDFARGGLFVGGVRIPGAITVYQPWEVPPGAPGVVTTVNGSRTLRVQVADTFV